MKNLIPRFIIERYLEKKNRGEFLAVSLFLDISGFTPMTEKLMSHHKEGAEILNKIMNDLFGPIIDVIYSYDGFISGFAGDSITALFPIPPGEKTNREASSISAASAIREIFSQRRHHQTKYGTFEIGGKIGLSFGSVDWGILGSGDFKSFYFRGDAIDGCTRAEQACKTGEIVIEERLYNLLARDPQQFIPLRSGFYTISPEFSSETMVKRSGLSGIPKLYEKALAHFVPDSIRFYRGGGEFREVVPVFISFREIDDFQQLDEFVSRLIMRIHEFGGYLEMIDFGDKGSTMLVLFGVPITYEKYVEHAGSFIHSIRSECDRRIRAGLAFGTVFSGIKGSDIRATYGVIGDVVNLAARLMMKAEWGQILVSESVRNKTYLQFEMGDLGKTSVKGKTHPVTVYELLDRKKPGNHLLYQDSLGPLIGRTRELDSVIESIDALKSGTFGGVVYIYGDAGCGKSRFLIETQRRVHGHYHFFLLQSDSILRKSLYPFKHAFGKYFQQLSDHTEHENKESFQRRFDEFIATIEENPVTGDDKNLAGELKRTYSLLGALLGHEWSGSLYEGLDPQGRFENTLYAIKSFFKAQSLLGPLVLVVEDIHWLDEDSQKVFDVLTRNIDPYPILIMASSRYYDDGSKPRLSVSDTIVSREVSLQNFTDEAIAEFIRHQLGGRTQDKLLDFIQSRTAGNPFFMEQFCTYLLENNLLEKTGGTYTLKIDEIADIPTGINALLIARLDRLSLELRETIQLAAILGFEFDATILRELVHQLHTHLEENEPSLPHSDGIPKISLEPDSVPKCLSKGITVRLWHTMSEMRYLFSHVLLRDAAYEMQLKARLRFLHALAARVHEFTFPDNPEYYSDLAFHYVQAEDDEKAREYLEKAGDYAAHHYHNDEAIRFYDRLLSGPYLSQAEQIEVKHKKAHILQFIGKWDQAESEFRRCIEWCTESRDNHSLAKNLNMLACVLEVKGLYQEAIPLLEQALKHFIEYGDDDGTGRTYYARGRIFWRQGKYNEAMDALVKFKHYSGKTGNRKNVGVAIGNIGNIHFMRDHYKEAMDHYKKWQEIATEVGDRRSLSIAIGMMGNIFGKLGEKTKAMQCYKDWLKIAEELGDKQYIGYAIGNIGSIYFDQGYYDKAMECYQINMQNAREIGDTQDIGALFLEFGTLYAAQGKFSEARDSYIECLKIAEKINDKLIVCNARAGLGNICLEEEAFAQAELNFNQAIELARELQSKNYLSEFLYYKAKLCFFMKRYDEAQTLNVSAVNIAQELENHEVLFYTSVLDAKICAATEKKEQAITRLKKLLTSITENEQQALLFFELYLLTSDPPFRKKAENIYLGLYENIPKYDYKRNLDILRQNT